MNKVLFDKITELGIGITENFSLSIHGMEAKYNDVLYNILNSKKGVLVVGSIGCGKTVLMKTIQRLLKDDVNRFRRVQEKQLFDMLDDGVKVSEILELYGKRLNMNLYIDDICSRKPKNFYGNWVSIIEEIVLERYELFLNTGLKTHFSSNTITKSENTESIESILGARTYDRITEMCNLVTWNSKSLRNAQ